VDCVVGKEAVVGKIHWAPSVSRSPSYEPGERALVDRADQAYGYELVHQGFVVLAPDSINCGERNIEPIRIEGENRKCWYIIDPHLGKEMQFKHVIDGIRAIDLLHSLDFVDSERIGAVGHSMGSEDVYWLMAFDDRLKAGILSPGLITGVAGRFMPLLAPRLYIGLWPTFDNVVGSEGEGATQQAYEFARECYRQKGASEYLSIHKLDCGHRFVDAFKWSAYKRLKEYFDILPSRERMRLGPLVKEARRKIGEAWEGYHDFPEPDVSRDGPVLASEEEMISAIAGLFLHLLGKGHRVALHVSTKVTSDRCILECNIPCAAPTQIDESKVTEETMRGVEQTLAEHDATLCREHSDNEIRYILSFPKVSSDV